MNDLLTRDNVLRIWHGCQCHDCRQVERLNTGTEAVSVALHDDARKLDAAMDKLLADVVGKEDFADTIERTRAAEAREDAANFGANADEEPERWDLCD